MEQINIFRDVFTVFETPRIDEVKGRPIQMYSVILDRGTGLRRKPDLHIVRNAKISARKTWRHRDRLGTKATDGYMWLEIGKSTRTASLTGYLLKTLFKLDCT